MRTMTGWKSARALVTALAITLSSGATAEPLTFFGKVGDAPVFVSIDRDGEKLSGWYIYLNQAKSIDLQGKVDPGGAFSMNESSLVKGKRTGTGSFLGRTGTMEWAGTWRAPGGRTLPVSLRHDRDPLTMLNTSFRCRASQPGGDYAFSQSVTLAARDGRLNRLSLWNGAKGGDDEQSCSLELGELTPIRSEAGILLRALDDDDTDKSEDARHCRVHIQGAGDYLVVRLDGCLGAGDTMFCSARGSWPDFVLNIRRQSCKPID